MFADIERLLIEQATSEIGTRLDKIVRDAQSAVQDLVDAEGGARWFDASALKIDEQMRSAVLEIAIRERKSRLVYALLTIARKGRLGEAP